MDELLNELFGDWLPVALLLKAAFVVQILLIVHVVKTGRPYYWIFILFMAPLLGGMVYFFVEVYPEWRLSQVRGVFQGFKPKSWRIRELKAQAEDEPTLHTRFKIADELLLLGDAAGALEIVRDGAEGVFRSDPTVLVRIALFQLEAGHPEEALRLLPTGPIEGDKFLKVKADLYRVRALVESGRFAEAEVLLPLVQSHTGACVRYLEARIAQGKGDNAQAAKIATEILEKYRKGTRVWRRSEKPWYAKTKQLQRATRKQN